MSGAHNQVSIGAVLGASGSGKSSLIKLELLEAQPPRRLIWDPKGEYRRYGTSSSKLQALAHQVGNAGAGGPFSVVFHPARSRSLMRDQFDVFCKIADEAKNCWVIADELADVTEPGWAPEGWEMLTRQGRHAGITIRGASQRPADIDKSFYGNASHIAVFRMNAEGDVDRCSKILGVDKREVLQLQPLEWIERDMLTGERSKKKLTLDEVKRANP